jgi:hypothetical protein
LLALFQNQERKTVSIYAKYHVTDPSHNTNMHTSSIARLRSSRSAIALIRIRVESLEWLIKVNTGKQVKDDVRSKKTSLSSQQLFVRTLRPILMIHKPQRSWFQLLNKCFCCIV